MAKYEIMLVVNGEIDEQLANKTCDDLNASLQNNNINLTKLGLKDLAYEIKKVKKGYYFQSNFENSDPSLLKEYDRLAKINKNVLRHLIINLEKDYGYKAVNNSKKVAKNEKRKVIHERVQEEMRKRTEERLLAQQNLNKE
ncbi:MAG: 30S ribosomal protein S6 [Ureaplasma sp.]|nr:30S ribosomal protein S6 [Ureaplasma sp.]MDE7221998.1 30S ribosomal protein S6 [Ureaplasma sp.]